MKLSRPLAFAIGLLAATAADAGELWTVQAMRANGAIVCDAFATGAVPEAGNRVPYEFRFRRSDKQLLLIVSYAGPTLGSPRDAVITLDGRRVGTFAVTPTRFGERAAVIVSLNPASVDFHDLERHRKLALAVGSVRFEMAMLATDRVADALDACAKFAKSPS